MKTKKLMAVIAAAAFAAVVLLTGCSKKGSTDESSAVEEENVKYFTITLYPDVAPITCENFQKLIEEKFYDGLTFHRVVDGFMAQGGMPDKTVPDTIKGEFADNGIENDLSHTRGVVSMARLSNDMDSASSQFFICYTDCSGLDGQYAAFGKVTEGMETVDGFLTVERTIGTDGAISAPLTPITIVSAYMGENDADGNPTVIFEVTY